jgi:hypothetical protein
VTETETQIETANAGGRWGTYVKFVDEGLAAHWTQRFSAGAKVCLIMGVGFDPRMCLSLSLLREAAPSGQLSVKTIDFDSPTDEVAAESAVITRAQFDTLTDGVELEFLDVPSRDGIENFARASADLFETLDQFDHSDIIVDVNALPRALFFPLIAKLLFLCDERGREAPNLHVFAGNAAWLDQLIEDHGLDENAVWLHPFSAAFLSESDEYLPRVWMPVLGEGDTQSLERISELVAPAEVCPLLPFPAKSPRRGDRLFEHYREVLFDQLRADSGTVIYGDEGNPFQVYRRLRRSTLHYVEALKPLNGCKVAYSALSSKLIALGVLLVAYEFLDSSIYETGVAEIGTQGHRLKRLVSLDEARAETELVGLTLAGDCYR